MPKLLVASLILGTVLNVAGWAGNAIVLKPLWLEASESAPHARALEPRWLHEALTFVSDYVFAFVVCAVYRLGLMGWQRSRAGLAVLASVLVWIAGVPMTYLALINAGYLPLGVSIATSLWALLTFVVFAPLLPFLLPASDFRRAAAQP